MKKPVKILIGVGIIAVVWYVLKNRQADDFSDVDPSQIADMAKKPYLNIENKVLPPSQHGDVIPDMKAPGGSFEPLSVPQMDVPAPSLDNLMDEFGVIVTEGGSVQHRMSSVNNLIAEMQKWGYRVPGEVTAYLYQLEMMGGELSPGYVAGSQKEMNLISQSRDVIIRMGDGQSKLTTLRGLAMQFDARDFSVPSFLQEEITRLARQYDQGYVSSRPFVGNYFA